MSLFKNMFPQLLALLAIGSGIGSVIIAGIFIPTLKNEIEKINFNVEKEVKEFKSLEKEIWKNYKEKNKDLLISEMRQRREKNLPSRPGVCGLFFLR